VEVVNFKKYHTSPYLPWGLPSPPVQWVPGMSGRGVAAYTRERVGELYLCTVY
jgi:hypothetical protein